MTCPQCEWMREKLPKLLRGLNRDHLDSQSDVQHLIDLFDERLVSAAATPREMLATMVWGAYCRQSIAMKCAIDDLVSIAIDDHTPDDVRADHARRASEMLFPPSPLTSVLTWVPVSERLPEAGPMGLPYLCCDADTGFVEQCSWLPVLGKWFDGANIVEADEYTHWAKIELPQPPTSEEREG